MKLEYHLSPLVIIGGWNSSIFTPLWIGRHFENTEFLDPISSEKPDEYLINIGVNLRNSFSIKNSPMTVKLKGVDVQLQETSLSFTLSEESYDFIQLEKLSSQICKYLIETPVSSYSINFGFAHKNINEEILLSIKGDNTIINKSIGSSLDCETYTFLYDIDGIRTNIGNKIDYINNIITVSFNFHFNIQDLSEFISGISENPINKMKEKAVNILSEHYNLQLEV